MSRVVGLIGGMSWQTTAVYYREINRHVNAQLGGIHSANILLQSLDYATMGKLISTGDFANLTKLICRTGQNLKAAGAQGLVLCANVAHKSADELERHTGLPVLHIADFTGQAIVKSKIKRIGLLATRAVMEEDFYKARLRDRYGLEVFVPPANFRARADKDIFENMSRDLIPAETISAWREAFQDLVDEHQVEGVALACTELQFIFKTHELPIATFETTAIHAKGIADWLLGGDGGRI